MVPVRGAFRTGRPVVSRAVRRAAEAEPAAATAPAGRRRFGTPSVAGFAAPTARELPTSSPAALVTAYTQRPPEASFRTV